MTVQSSLARIQYTVSGAGPYSIPFMFLADADLVVYSQAAGFDPALLTLTTDYTITGAEDENGGALTLVSPNDGETLTIINEPEILQLTDYPEVGKFPAASHERALDLLTIIAKRTYDMADRSLRLNDAAAATSLEFPAPLPGQLIGWDVDGELVNTSPSGVGPGSIGTSELADGSVTFDKFASTSGLFLGDVIKKSTTYTITAADRGKIIVHTGGTTVTLPDVTAVGAGFAVAIQTSGYTTVAAHTGQNIDGYTSNATLRKDSGLDIHAPRDTLVVVSDGSSGWFSLGFAPSDTTYGVATTSGSTAEITSLPANIKGFRLDFFGVSVNNTDPIIIQIGDSFGYVITGYLGGASNNAGYSANSNGAKIRTSTGTANDKWYGSIEFNNAYGDEWVFAGNVAESVALPGNVFSVAGKVNMSSDLTSVRLTTLTSTGSFDAGFFTITTKRLR